MNFQDIIQKRRSINFFDPKKNVSEDIWNYIQQNGEKNIKR